MDLKTETIVNTKAYLELTEINQQKVLCIYQLAVIYKEMNRGKLTPKAFDTLYDTELDMLEQYTEFSERAYIVLKHLRNEIDWE